VNPAAESEGVNRLTFKVAELSSAMKCPEILYWQRPMAAMGCLSPNSSPKEQDESRDSGAHVTMDVLYAVRQELVELVLIHSPDAQHGLAVLRWQDHGTRYQFAH